MLKIKDCPECDRLWAEYEQATRRALILESKFQIASYSHDSEGIIKLLPGVEESHQLRRSIRRQLIAHIRKSHAGADAAEA
jgi:hypothetical protein